jgi:hypothetical protein
MDGYRKVSTPAISRISTAHEPSIVDSAAALGGDSRASTSGTDNSRTNSSRQQAAATKIQALGRGFNLRNDWAKEDAAILIQSVYRGYRYVGSRCLRTRSTYLITNDDDDDISSQLMVTIAFLHSFLPSIGRARVFISKMIEDLISRGGY